jgi:NAD(P)-dependent dehydrogenase (short-subunit alcohol dehydrogenase family)
MSGESLDDIADNLPDRVAIITGASSGTLTYAPFLIRRAGCDRLIPGIGRASAIALSAAGWKVVLFGRREEELRNTAELCRWETFCFPGDVTKEEDVQELFNQTIATFGTYALSAPRRLADRRRIYKGRLDLLFNVWFPSVIGRNYLALGQIN